MPIYTYKCKSCGKIFEKFKNMSSNGKEYCEGCSSEALRVFTPAGIIFKGSGFYTTDYKSGSNKAHTSTPAQKDEKKEVKSQEKTPDSTTASTTAKTSEEKDRSASSHEKDKS